MFTVSEEEEDWFYEFSSPWKHGDTVFVLLMFSLLSSIVLLHFPTFFLTASPPGTHNKMSSANNMHHGNRSFFIPLQTHNHGKKVMAKGFCNRTPTEYCQLISLSFLPWFLHLIECTILTYVYCILFCLHKLLDAVLYR